MTSRNLFIALIRETVRGRPIEEVQRYANTLPAQVDEGAWQFSRDYGMGYWIANQIITHDISVAHELYVFIEESKLAVVASKGVRAPGDKSHGK